MGELLDDEVSDMASLNHSLTAGRIAGLLFNDERFEVMPELSLDGSQIDLSQFGIKNKEELIPDVAVYTDPPPQPSPMDDVLMVSQMPDLVIEVLSPKQRISEIFAKFKAYFALGVKSCWLALPLIEVIDVYSQPDQHRTFDMNDTEVIDEVMDIRLPIAKVFKR
jgi:Uma2 family endonuclease